MDGPGPMEVALKPAVEKKLSNMKMRVVLLAMVLVLSVRTKCEDELMLDVYEMYGSPISEKTSVESSVMLRYNGNVSFTSLCQGRAIGYTESRLENIECVSLDGVSDCSGNDRDGVVISLDSSKTIQFGSSASDEVVLKMRILCATHSTQKRTTIRCVDCSAYNYPRDS